MKAINFFKYSDRLSLYKNLYRDLMKSAAVNFPDDPMVRGHIKIKSRYLIKQIKYKHELGEILQNYDVVANLVSDVKRGDERLIKEAYGLLKEKEIESMLLS